MPGKLVPRKSSIHDARIAGLYDLEHTIGKGHFAVVKLARHVFTGEKVAVKVIDKTKLDALSQSHMMQEVRCMKLVQHPNIVRLYEVIDTSSRLFLILELGDYDMYDFIMKNENKGIKENDAQQYFSQIIKAIDYCHTLHVVHRDLKPENVVFFEKLGMVKLTDFGFSNLFTPGQQLQTSCGSLAYSAPEILLGDAYDAPAVDIWSLGVILYMLVCGRLPFQETNESETLTKILDCRYAIPEHISQNCRHLIGRMLVRDPLKRATLPEIIQSPWVVAGDRGHAETLPLIAKDQLPISAHSTIIDQMVAGGIATEESIINAIDNDEYNYISATYYLLAERVLASYREEQANRLMNLNREEELSENGEPGGVSTTGSATPNYHSRSRSNSWRGSASRRACTILKEESEEELSTYLKSSRQSSRFYKDTLPLTTVLRREHSQHSSSRPSLVTSRTSSCESFIPIMEEDDSTSFLVADAVAKLENELNPNETMASNSSNADDLPPINEIGEQMYEEADFEDKFLRPISLSVGHKRHLIRSAASFDMGDIEQSTPLASYQAPAIKLLRTPSAPISSAVIMARKRFLRPPLLRRNSSPSVSMFAGNFLHSSRDRISPQAIQDLLEFSRFTGGMKRAASPDSRISSRSPSPNSSGRTSPAISSGFMRLKVTIPSTGGMRKLSSSPHLLGICEESEDNGTDSPPVQNSTSRSVSTFSGTKNPHIGRGNRSASIGFSGNFSSSKSSKDETTYSSVRVIRPRQAVVSPDMARRYDQHQKFISRSRRSTSCSSSETSDDDSNERKLNLIGSKYCKRNFDDKNNDDDEKGGGGGNNGPKRSNSMKEQTILEEPSSTENKNGNSAETTNKTVHESTRGFLTPDSPSSSKSFYSESDASFSRQISAPLQPIMEHDSFSKRCLFSRSTTAKEALHDWLQESLNFQDQKQPELESPRKIRWCCQKNALARYGTDFYRPLKKSKSMTSIPLNSTEIEQSHSMYANLSNLNNNELEGMLSTSTSSGDSGCSSDEERKNYKDQIFWLSEFTKIGHDLGCKLANVFVGEPEAIS